jgi:hypothetical protein
MQKIVRRRGEIKTIDMANAKKINACRGVLLDCEYYECDNKLYKKLPNNQFRELVKQDFRPEYNHYFLRDKNKRKLTINANKLDLLSYIEDNIDANIKDNSKSLSIEMKDLNVDGELKTNSELLLKPSGDVSGDEVSSSV